MGKILDALFKASGSSQDMPYAGDVSNAKHPALVKQAVKLNQAYGTGDQKGRHPNLKGGK